MPWPVPIYFWFLLLLCPSSLNGVTGLMCSQPPGQAGFGTCSCTSGSFCRHPPHSGSRSSMVTSRSNVTAVFPSMTTCPCHQELSPFADFGTHLSTLPGVCFHPHCAFPACPRSLGISVLDGFYFRPLLSTSRCLLRAVTLASSREILPAHFSRTGKRCYSEHGIKSQYP